MNYLARLFIDDRTLFKILTGIDFDKYNKSQKIRSPFRVDNNAGCYFEEMGSEIYFMDWADSPKRRSIWDVFDKVSGDYSIFDNIIEEGDLKLNLTSNNKSKEKPFKPIFYNKRPFNIDDVVFWEKGNITLDNLKDDRVFAIRDFTLFSTKKKEWINIKAAPLSYALTEDLTYKVKIYQPLSKMKWVGNFDKNVIFGLNKLKYIQDTLYISSGYKDNRCIRNLNLESIAFQNEGIFPDEDKILPVLKRYKRVVIIYDNDKAGRKASKLIKNTINSNFPKKATIKSLPEFDGKDIFEFVTQFGLQNLKQHL